MFKIAICLLALAPVSLFIGELNYIPVEMGRTLFAVFFVVGATCFSLGFISQEDVPKDPPVFDEPERSPTEPDHKRSKSA